ncbi:uncharacterized protein LOC132544837 [Ylistrum balloti]|uniref:uncharacterized protein LOC132544837 n=1 Tax=Ylistrum balloti TaxID=509963 RepID=UPI0029059A36|nr:uncharacterized protein LOC132544837 [Ylistrum balloti]
MFISLEGWTKADDENIHTNVLKRILSALDRDVERLEEQHANRELEADDTLADQLDHLARILVGDNGKDVTDRNMVNTKIDQSRGDTEKQGSVMTDETKDMVKKLIVSLVKKTKHCGPLHEGDVCADSHDCCCGYTCWKWRCQDKSEINSNWWEVLHNRS